MKKFVQLTGFFLVAIFSLQLTIAQENDGLQETLSKLSEDAASKYVAPIVSGFGANLNSGWVHKSPSSKVFGIDIEVGIVAMATMFGDNNKSFNTIGTFRFSQSQARSIIDNSTTDPRLAIMTDTQKNELAAKVAQQYFTVGINGPTIVGKKESEVMVAFSGADISYNYQTYKIDGQSIGTGAKGFLGDLSALPLFAPQFSLGTVYGTMATFRFLPSVELQDLGKFSYFGFGLQHNPAMYIPVPLPVDVSAAFFTQSLQVGDIFKATATTFGIFASKTFGIGISITPFAGFAIESSSVDVAYDVEYASPVPGTTIKDKIKFSMVGDNSKRMTIGASFKLALINLSIDYSIAKYNSASVGLGFVF